MPRAIDSTRRYDDDIVIQEFLSGPSISLELLGKGNEVFPLQTTQVILDEHFDCKMVLAPCQERFLDEGSFFEIGCRLGKAVRLQGIMDVEAIVHNGQPKVLELDARFPSQTPSAVLHSTGMNMVGMLCDWFVRDMPPRISHAEPRQAIYEHIQVRNGRLESFGEDMMAKCTGLHLVRGFHGADVALTDYNSDEAEWRATLITTGPDLASAWNRREKVLEHIMENEGLGVRYDSSLGGVAR
jgi:pyrrolysine biosynthesis protein PylC